MEMICESKEPDPQNWSVAQFPIVYFIGPVETPIYGQRAADIEKSQDWPSSLAVASLSAKFEDKQKNLVTIFQ